MSITLNPVQRGVPHEFPNADREVTPAPKLNIVGKIVPVHFEANLEELKIDFLLRDAAAEREESPNT